MRLATDKELNDLALEISKIINSKSLENTVDLPDFVIADHLVMAFKALNISMMDGKRFRGGE